MFCKDNKMYYLCITLKEKHKDLSKCFTQKVKNGAVAQLVEQRTENPCVDGSIPFVPT